MIFRRYRAELLDFTIKRKLFGLLILESFDMTFMNKIRKIIPTKKIEVNELERQPAAKNVISPNNTVHKAANEKSETDANDENLKDVNGEYKIIEREIFPEKLICPDCGSFTLEGLDYCANCGCEISN